MSDELSEERQEQLCDWDAGYHGTLMTLTRAELVEHLYFDGAELENGNYHDAAEGMRKLAALAAALPARTPIGFFAWSVAGLGPLRQCIVR